MIERIVHGEVVELRLSRPPVNALDPELLAGLAQAVSGETEGGALVISGTPGMFSAGLDIPHLMGLDRGQLTAALGVFFDAMEALASSPRPVAAAITGHSPAGGAILSLFCDWRVMAEGEYGIGVNEVLVGLPMPAVVAGLVARVVGVRQAERLCVSGTLLAPRQALELGFVDEVGPPGEVVETAVEWCRRLLALPSRAVEQTRRTCRADLVQLVARWREEDTRRLVEEWSRDEVQQAMRAMVARVRGR